MRFPKTRTLGSSLLAVLIALAVIGGIGAEPAAAVLNGHEVKKSSKRWQSIAALVTDSKNPRGSFLCGGTLIAPKLVLTAAHCYDTTRGGARPRFAKFGSKSLAHGGQIIRIVGHRKYSKSGRSSLMRSDIMLLELSRAPSRITPITLASASSEPTAGGTVSVAGWGTTNASKPSYPDRLREATVDRASDGACGAFRRLDTDLSMCASNGRGASTRMTCYGDSGGPLIRQTASGPVLVGITSSAPDGCLAAPYLSVFTRVAAFGNWITAGVRASVSTGKARR